MKLKDVVNKKRRIGKRKMTGTGGIAAFQHKLGIGPVNQGDWKKYQDRFKVQGFEYLEESQIEDLDASDLLKLKEGEQIIVGSKPWLVAYATGMKNGGILEKVFVRLYRIVNGRNLFQNYVINVSPI